jgi:N-acetylglutamate synthase-like GNAT family acetyltransferase
VSPVSSRTGKDGDEWLPHRIGALAAAPGPPVHIRQATASDRPALAGMLARCSKQTRERRFHKYVCCFPEPYLTEAVGECAAHFALIAQVGEAIVALASCVTADCGNAELAVLVEDPWQRLGVGARLLSLLVAHADQSGLERLKAWVLSSQAWLLPVLGHYGTCEAWLRHGVFEVTVHREGRRFPAGPFLAAQSG